MPKGHAEKLRAALHDAGTDGLTNQQIADALGIKGNQVGSILHTFMTRGETTYHVADDVRHYKLDSAYQPTRQRKAADALPIKRPKKTKRAKGVKKHTRTDRPFKALVEKHAAPAPQNNLLGLLYDNLIASAANLAATLRREVEGVENNPNLIAAIETQERALQIARAA